MAGHRTCGSCHPFGKNQQKRGQAGEVIGSTDRAEYIPFFIFNDVHLWTMQHRILYEGKNAIRLKRDWSKLDPSFAGWAHKTILNEALTPGRLPKLGADVSLLKI